MLVQFRGCVKKIAEVILDDQLYTELCQRSDASEIQIKIFLLDVDIHNYYWVWYNFVYVSSKWNHIIYDMWGYVFSSLSFIA